MKFTLEDLRARHSVRAYSSRPVEEEKRNKLKAEATFINSHEAGLNFRIVFDDGSPFDSFFKSYGRFKGVQNYLVAIVDPTFPDALERAGYFGEQFVMVARSMGLDSCFVGGTYSASDVPERVEVYEKIAFLIPFGYAAEKSSLAQKIWKSNKTRPKGRTLFEGSEEEYREACQLLPALPEALEAVAAAPSAFNKHPVRIFMQEAMDQDGMKKKVLAARTVKKSRYSEIDLGIAKSNFNSITEGFWEWGENAPFEI